MVQKLTGKIAKPGKCVLLFSCHYIVFNARVVCNIELTKLVCSNDTWIKPLSFTGVSHVDPKMGKFVKMPIL